MEALLIWVGTIRQETLLGAQTQADIRRSGKEIVFSRRYRTPSTAVTEKVGEAAVVLLFWPLYCTTLRIVQSVSRPG